MSPPAGGPHRWSATPDRRCGVVRTPYCRCEFWSPLSDRRVGDPTQERSPKPANTFIVSRAVGEGRSKRRAAGGHRWCRDIDSGFVPVRDRLGLVGAPRVSGDAGRRSALEWPYLQVIASRRAAVSGWYQSRDGAGSAEGQPVARPDEPP